MSGRAYNDIRDKLDLIGRIRVLKLHMAKWISPTCTYSVVLHE